MGTTCSRSRDHVSDADGYSEVPDPEIYDLLKQSVTETQPDSNGGQHHLLYKQQQQQQRTGKKSRSKLDMIISSPRYPTRLLIRRHAVRNTEEGVSGTHIYAMRWVDSGLVKESEVVACQEQCPEQQHKRVAGVEDRQSLLPSQPSSDPADQILSSDSLFLPETMAAPPKRKVVDWVTVSEEQNIHVADVGLTAMECEQIVSVTERVCRGQYAAYTYAKQTLGCREFPSLAYVVQDAVHTITHAILEYSEENTKQEGNKNDPVLALDDREPHMVKYDVTRRERQKLDMHTDKSEWTFLISLSNGGGLDFSGGGTYFECLDSTIHVQRGHALIFPGKLRHCGQRINSGLRFLLVGFLVDKSTSKGKRSERDGSQSQ